MLLNDSCNGKMNLRGERPRLEWQQRWEERMSRKVRTPGAVGTGIEEIEG